MEEKFDIVFYLENNKGGLASYREGSCTISMFEFDNLYVKQIEPDYPDMICTQMMFDCDTLKLKGKGHYLKFGGIGIGIWEYFNEDGTLHHIKNMDEHYPITWEKMEEILSNKDISLLSVDSVFRYYDEKKDEATWSIIVKTPMDRGVLYVFNAKTGELINEEIIDMSKEL